MLSIRKNLTTAKKRGRRVVKVRKDECECDCHIQEKECLCQGRRGGCLYAGLKIESDSYTNRRSQ